MNREDQVRKIDFATKLLLDDPRSDPLVREIIAGFLIARLSNGSFEYLGLCDPYLEKMPRVALWFALFAGLQRGSNVLSIADCLGRRLARRLVASGDLFSPIQCDIGFYELEARATSQKVTPRYRADIQNVTSVELLPGVAARFRAVRESSSLQQSAAHIDRSIVSQLRATFYSGMRLLDRIEDREPTLFNDPTGAPKGVEKRSRGKR